jgi:hypothetical protein
MEADMEIPGVLEIDHNRGVIYFHTDNAAAIEKYRTTLVLRICGLGTLPDSGIDITLRPSDQLNSGISALVSAMS